MIRTGDALRVGRALLGTPYGSGAGQLDCINLIKRIIRTAPGGVPSYTTAGTNALWSSANMAAKYRDLIWRQEGVAGARPGMLAFKRSGSDVHHVGLVTSPTTVLHSSSALGKVVETALDSNWHLLAAHRYIEVAGWSGEDTDEEDEDMPTLYRAEVATESGALNIRERPSTSGRVLGQAPKGALLDVLATGEWPRVRYGDVVGYALGSYLQRVEDEKTETPGETPGAEPGETDKPPVGEDMILLSLPTSVAAQVWQALDGALGRD